MRSTLPTFNEIWQRQLRAQLLSQHQGFPEHTRYLIACSGGMDSMLLLHVMSALFPHQIRALYINHQLQASSTAWGEFVQCVCQQLSIPCSVQAVDVLDGNLENQARQARYQAFDQHLKPHEILVLAHHQQDQAETLLLRLLSGSGIQGLAAMQAIDVREQMTLWRPLLDISREQIGQWVTQLNIQHIEDPTNQDTHYDRAWSREQLWPMLQQRFPKMQQALSRTSYLMQDASEILHEVLAEDWQRCGDARQLNIAALHQLSLARQRQLLSAWMKGNAQYRPSFDMVTRLQQEVIAAKADAQARLHCHEHDYVRYQGMLYRLETAEYLAESTATYSRISAIQIKPHHSFEVLSGHFKVKENQKIGLSFALLERELTLNLRQGGEKIHLQGRVGSWPLKKAIQAAHIFPWQRHTIQILSIDDVMLGVFTPKGFWLAESSYCQDGGWLPQLV